MRSDRFSLGARMVTLVVVMAMGVVFLGAAGGFLADPETSGEPCIGCAGCETGECGDGHEDPLTSHHHCCTTCCLSHAAVTLGATALAQAPAIAGTMPARPLPAMTGRDPETPYRPPRV